MPSKTGARSRFSAVNALHAISAGRLGSTHVALGFSPAAEPPARAPDNKRIDLHDRNEVRHWTQSLGVSEEELKRAVAQVGTSAQKVREHLGK
jgi:hypothetical protein